MSVSFVNVNEIKNAIADVRNDRTSTNWVLVGYTGENTNDVHLVGKGDGGIPEIIDQLHDSIHNVFIFLFFILVFDEI